MENILKRRSVRKYTEQPIDYETLKKLCYAGFAAPTARRQKSMSFVIIDDKTKLEQLSTTSSGAKMLAQAKACIAVIGNDPNKMVTPHMQVQDLSAATQNILLAATSLNIGSCWIGVYPIEERMKVVNEVLNIKEGDFPFSLISLGYPLDENAFFELHKEDDNMIYHNEVK